MNTPKLTKFLFTDEIKKKIPGLKIGAISGQNVSVTKNSHLADSEMNILYNFIQSKFDTVPPSSDETVSAVRRMYRRIGWEPTRYRPSAEAMIRRILKNTELYNINNLVDLGNIVSARYHLPLGLYDRDKINGPVVADVGRRGEVYEGLSIPEIHAEGKLILRDDSGIFGNPTADSKRTSIEKNTKNILGVFFTPPEISDNYIQNTLSHLTKLYRSECPKVSIDCAVFSAQ